MNSIINQKLENYHCVTKEDYLESIKEIAQELILSALAQTDFFEHAAFYGGTALRIYHGLDRFSEDLDFSLLKKENFDITNYFEAMRKQLASYGFLFETELKEKNINSSIQSAFLKENTLEQFLLIHIDPSITHLIQKNELIKIKLEIDINPPSGANFEYKYSLFPFPYQVTLYDYPSLFSGKLHAILCRNWKDRIKGRDLYDYIFYLRNKIKPNMTHLKMRLVESGKWNMEDELDMIQLKNLLVERFEEIDFNEAKKDVIGFIKDVSVLDLWSKDFFISITNDYLN